jgi:CspA family cold shock protein
MVPFRGQIRVAFTVVSAYVHPVRACSLTCWPAPKGFSFKKSLNSDVGRAMVARPVAHLCALLKETTMSTGTVKFYNADRGYGFIQPDDGSKDVFVHATALEAAGMRGLSEGQKVSFEVRTDSRSGKLAAANLQAA